MQKKNGANVKNTPKMALRARKTTNQEGNTPTTPNLQGNNEKSLIDTIRKIVQEEFKEHETKMSEMISHNLQNTNDRLDKISKEMNELTKSLEFTQDQLEGEINSIKENIKHLETSIKGIEDDLLDPNDVSSKLIELEDRSRRNNLRIDGIEEIPNETWEDCEIKIQELIKNKLKINEHIEIDRCHRLSKKKNQNRPRTIICRITKFKEKQKILKNAKLLKNTGIFIYEDFCKDTMELRKELWQEVLEYRRQNKFAYLNYRSIVVCDHGRDSVR